MSLPNSTRYTARDAREIKATGKSIRRTFKTLAECAAYMKANGLDPAVTLCIDLAYIENGKLRMKRVHTIADAEKFAAGVDQSAVAKALAAAKPAKAASPAPQAAHNAPEPAAMAQVTSPAPESAVADKPERALKLVKTGTAGTADGGNGFAAPAKKSRRPAMAAGINEKNEARATARNVARASKK